MENAELVLIVADGSVGLAAEDMDIIAAPVRGRRVLVMNKSDLPAAGALPDTGLPAVRVSARDGTGLAELAGLVRDMFAAAPVPQGEIITSERQAAELSRAADALRQAEEAAVSGVTPDAVLCLVEEAREAVGSVTGRTVRDDVVARIFQRFCVGK